MAERDFFSEEFEQKDFFSEDFGESKPKREPGLTGIGKILPTLITGQTPKRGERTLLGNIFERPAAAVRENIRAPLGEKEEGLRRGFEFPEESETFQEESIRRAMKAFGGPSESVAVNFAKGLLPSAAGLVQDVITSPADTILNLTGLSLFSKGARTAKTLSRLNELQKINKINKTVDKTITKAIKPSVVGKKTFGQAKRAKELSRSAVDSIVENKQNLRLIDKNNIEVNRLPTTLDEFSQSIEQTKRTIFNQYDELLQQSGSSGKFIDTGDIAKELDVIINNEILAIKEPRIISYASGLKESLLKQGKLTASQADELIRLNNQDLKLFYRSPTPDLSSTTRVDALITNKLRSKLDELISKTSELKKGEFQVIKSKHGALTSIEEDVAKRTLANAKSPIRSLIDYTDVFSGGQVIEGIVFHKPASILRGTAQIGIKKILKLLNEPNIQINDMFKQVDQLKKSSALLNLFPITGTLPTSTKALDR